MNKLFFAFISIIAATVLMMSVAFATDANPQTNKRGAIQPWQPEVIAEFEPVF